MSLLDRIVGFVIDKGNAGGCTKGNEENENNY
jgi:hypothetical protein